MALVMRPAVLRDEASAMTGPESLIWIITGRCNLRCPYCYAEQYISDKELGAKEVIGVLEEAADTGVRHVQFTGGEPLLRGDIIDILEAATRLGLEASIFTNMTLMNNRVAARLAKLGVDVYTSLDGPRDIYELIKGKGSWEHFLSGIRAVKTAGLWLHVNIPVSRLNFNRVGDAIRLAIDLGADSISLIPAMPSGRALRTKTFIKQDQFLRALRDAEQAAEELGIEIAVWCAPFTRLLSWAKHLVASNCRDWLVMDIAPNGDVLLCDVTGIRVANVVRDGVLEAWRKLLEHPLMKAAMKIPEECKDCAIRAWCRGGCYARALVKYNELPAPDPLCPLTIGRS